MNLHRHWSGVTAAWPYACVGLCLGVGIGYVVGELSRRKLGIEQASEKALRESVAMANAASEKTYNAECMMGRAQNLYSTASRLQEKVSLEQEIIRAMEQMADERIRSGEEKLRHAESLEKQLTKARAKIRRLEEKIDRLTVNND